MKTVPLEIITPENVFLRDEVEFIVAPGFEGELGVLPGHTRLMARLIPGELHIVKGQETRKFNIEGGFIHIEPASVKIVTPMIKPL
jgi:F-type H+-transporting ATPase subunit epsilon